VSWGPEVIVKGEGKMFLPIPKGLNLNSPGCKTLVYAHIFVLQEWHAKEGCDKVIENYFEVNGVGNPGVTKA